MMEYCYFCDACGDSKTERFRLGAAAKSIRCHCGKRMRRDHRREHRKMHVADYGPEGKTWYDIATHPEDVDHERKLFKEIGIGAQIRADGGIVCHSDKQRQKVLKLLGL